MTTHLSEDQITDVLCGATLPDAAREHFDSCIVCRKKVDGLVRTTIARRTELEREVPDWKAQKAAVLDAISNRSPADQRRGWRWIRPALAAAAIVTMAVAAGLLHSPSTPRLAPTPFPELPIEQILAQTDTLLDDDPVPGFDVFAELDQAELNDLLPALGS